MSNMQTKLMSENDNDIFIDGTFLVSPECSYQLIITRISLDKYKYYFTTSFSLATDKKEKTYIDILEKIRDNIQEYRFNENSTEPYKPKTFHCDFEMSIINAINSVFPDSNIKLCNFHYNQNIEKNRKKFIN